MIQAISLALGARADSSFVRSGENKAIIQLQAEYQDKDYIITREISRNGKNVRGSWQAQLRQLVACLTSLQGEGQTPAALFDAIIDYYQPVFEKLYFDDYPKHSRDLDQLKALAAGYGDLRAFVDDTALDPPESEAAGESGHRLTH